MTGGKYPQPIQTPQHVRILIPVASRKSIIGEEGISQTIANRTIQESFIVHKSQLQIRSFSFHFSTRPAANVLYITSESKCDLQFDEDSASLETIETILTVSTVRNIEYLIYVSLRNLIVNIIILWKGMAVIRFFNFSSTLLTTELPNHLLHIMFLQAHSHFFRILIFAMILLGDSNDNMASVELC